MRWCTGQTKKKSCFLSGLTEVGPEKLREECPTSCLIKFLVMNFFYFVKKCPFALPNLIILLPLGDGRKSTSVFVLRSI